MKSEDTPSSCCAPDRGASTAPHAGAALATPCDAVPDAHRGKTRGRENPGTDRKIPLLDLTDWRKCVDMIPIAAISVVRRRHWPCVCALERAYANRNARLLLMGCVADRGHIQTQPVSRRINRPGGV